MIRWTLIAVFLATSASVFAGPILADVGDAGSTVAPTRPTLTHRVCKGLGCRQSCLASDGLSCVLAAQNVGGASNLAAAIDFAERGCTLTEGRSCILAASLLALKPTDPAIRQKRRSTTDRGIALLDAGCALSQVDDCEFLSETYRDALVVPKDLAKALDYLKRGCATGEATACSNLGSFYEDANPPDFHSAAVQYEFACKKGNMRGCANLADLVGEGKSGPADAVLAVALLRRACDSNDARGCALLGRRLVAGRDVPRNAPKGRELLARACKADYQDACESKENVPPTRPLSSLVDCEKQDYDACENVCVKNNGVCTNGCINRHDATMCRIACDNGDPGACRDRCSYWLLTDHSFDGLPPATDSCEGFKRSMVTPRMLEIMWAELRSECNRYRSNRNPTEMNGIISMLRIAKSNLKPADTLSINHAINECIRSVH